MSIKSKPPGYFSINLLYLMNYYQWGCIITRASPESLMGKGSNSLTVTTNGLARVRPMGGLIPLLKIIDPMAEREIGSDKAGASCWVRDPAGGDQRRQSRFISCRSAMRCFEPPAALPVQLCTPVHSCTAALREDSKRLHHRIRNF